jgi:NADH-quinone oxidoreductase subunit N
MNVLILSAILGVVLLFSGIYLKQKSSVRAIAITGMAGLLLCNILEMSGMSFFRIDIEGMMRFDKFALLFISIILFSTLFYFVLSAKEMEKVGIHYAEYFALIFFILCGVVLVASFKSLLILFLGIEIISIPLYILTGSDKRNLKSNEASLKYFLMGAFSTGLMLMGITLIYGARGTFNVEQMQFGVDKPGVLLVAGMMLLLWRLKYRQRLFISGHLMYMMERQRYLRHLWLPL